MREAFAAGKEEIKSATVSDKVLKVALKVSVQRTRDLDDLIDDPNGFEALVNDQEWAILSQDEHSEVSLAAKKHDVWMKKQQESAESMAAKNDKKKPKKKKKTEEVTEKVKGKKKGKKGVGSDDDEGDDDYDDEYDDEYGDESGGDDDDIADTGTGGNAAAAATTKVEVPDTDPVAD